MTNPLTSDDKGFLFMGEAACRGPRERHFPGPNLALKSQRAWEQVYSSSQGCLAATGTHHVPYGITQCYLPPGRGDILALTTYEAGTRFSDPGGMRIGADGCAVQKRMNRYKAHDQIIRFSLAQLSREPVWGRSRLIFVGNRSIHRIRRVMSSTHSVFIFRPTPYESVPKRHRFSRFAWLTYGTNTQTKKDMRTCR